MMNQLSNNPKGTGRSTGRLRLRTASASVEFAVCLPVLITLVLGSMEASHAIFLKQALVTSAYEGVREAVRADGTTSGALARAQNVLTLRNVRGATIDINPAIAESVGRGEEITVTITAPYDQNSPFVGKFFSSQSLSAEATMIKEKLL